MVFMEFLLCTGPKEDLQKGHAWGKNKSGEIRASPGREHQADRTLRCSCAAPHRALRTDLSP